MRFKGAKGTSFFLLCDKKQGMGLPVETVRGQESTNGPLGRLSNMRIRRPSGFQGKPHSLSLILKKQKSCPRLPLPVVQIPGIVPVITSRLPNNQFCFQSDNRSRPFGVVNFRNQKIHGLEAHLIFGYAYAG